MREEVAEAEADAEPIDRAGDSVLRRRLSNYIYLPCSMNEVVKTQCAFTIGI